MIAGGDEMGSCACKQALGLASRLLEEGESGFFPQPHLCNPWAQRSLIWFQLGNSRPTGCRLGGESGYDKGDISWLAEMISRHVFCRGQQYDVYRDVYICR